MKLHIAVHLMLLGAVNAAGAAVSPATVSSSLDVGYMQHSTQTSFGTHRLSGAGDASTTIGGDAAGTPFIQFAATTPNTLGSTPYLTGVLNYEWEIVSADGSNAPVLVHISTAGWINARYEIGPYPVGINLNFPNTIDIAVTAKFTTQTNTGIDTRAFGLQSGGVNLGVTRVAPEYHFAPQSGGYSLVAANFSNSFDLWVMPNTRFGNSIQMYVQTGFRQDNPFINDYAVESYVSKGFIDPVITIDPAQAGQYSLNVSSIPLAPVPEASTLAMMLAGLGLVGGAAARRRRG